MILPVISTSTQLHDTQRDANKELCGGSNSVICSDNCLDLIACPSGTVVSNCDSTSLYCHHPTTGNAVCLSSARCDGAPLKCAQDGIFPDPYFCTKYHTCATSLGYSEVHDCGAFAFNIATSSCNLPLDDPICQGPVPECASFLQTGALPSNPRYYYRCNREGILLYPNLFTCPAGSIFEESSQACEGNTTPFPERITCSSDCTSLVLVPENVIVADCASVSQYCHNVPLAEAVCSTVPRCDGAPLKCSQSGVFPDPYFCNKYHICSDVAGSYSLVLECGEFAYNIATGECNLPLDDIVCKGPVPECATFLQFDAIAANPKYYYRCGRDGNNILYPNMFQCATGEVFDVSNGSMGGCTPAKKHL